MKQNEVTKYDDLINTKVNMLTIKKLIYDRDAHIDVRYKYLCDCDCGIKDVSIPCRNITYNNQKSCGCFTGGVVAGGMNPYTKAKYEKLINTKEGTLTIKELVFDKHAKGSYRYKYLCDCDCGTKDKLILCYSIAVKKQKSCGCLQGNVPVINHDANIGRKFGNLTVLAVKRLKLNTCQHKEIHYECKCDCGCVKLYRPRNLLTGASKSCGCNQINNAVKKYESYIGKRYGALTVIKSNFYPEKEQQSERHTLTYKCDCGNEVEFPIYYGILDIKDTKGTKKTCGECFASSSAYDNYLELLDYCKEHKLELLSDYTTKSSSKIVNTGNVSTMYIHYQFKCLVCKRTFHKTLHPYQALLLCPYCNKQFASNVEYLIAMFLSKHEINFNKDYIPSVNNEQNKVQIDFNCPDHNVGLELHGLEVHSTHEDLYSLFHSKSKNYHLNKLESAKAQNIDLLQFWNTEVYQKSEIVKSIILNRLNKTEHSEYARKCYVKEIEKPISDNFLLTHHIQGSVPNDSVRLGLFHKKTDNLVSVMTFGISRFSQHEWELFRFTTHINCRVVGSASKLFKYFVTEYDPESIVSYSDRRLFEFGKLYSILGFELDHISPPNYWYFVKGPPDQNIKLYHRTNFQKHKLSKLLKTFDPDKTEVENMERNGYLRVYDCGSKVYFWKKENELKI